MKTFERVWNYKGPPRIQHFLWKVAHNRLLTNLQRNKRDMDPSAICPRCQSADESIMHAIRDCSHVQETWNLFIPGKDWSRFYSQGLSSWLDWNLGRHTAHPSGCSSTILFGVIAWSIWRDRCALTIISQCPLIWPLASCIRLRILLKTFPNQMILPPCI